MSGVCEKMRFVISVADCTRLTRTEIWIIKTWIFWIAIKLMFDMILCAFTVVKQIKHNKLYRSDTRRRLLSPGVLASELPLCVRCFNQNVWENLRPLDRVKETCTLTSGLPIYKEIKLRLNSSEGKNARGSKAKFARVNANFERNNLKILNIHLGFVNKVIQKLLLVYTKFRNYLIKHFSTF